LKQLLCFLAAVLFSKKLREIDGGPQLPGFRALATT
jgi:hypothetical protein